MLIVTLPTDTWERIDDALALDQALGGEEQALNRLYRQHYLKVANLAMHLTASRDDAEDIAQIVFLRAFRSIGSIRDGQAFEKYLIRSVVNLVRDRAKLRARKPWTFLLDWQGENGQQFETEDRRPTPESATVSALRDAALRQAIQNLPLQVREVLVLHHLQEMEVREISETLGIPEGTVKSRLGRARQRLRNELGGWQ